jgi:hypothetical protein
LGTKYSDNITNQKSILLSYLIEEDQFSKLWKFTRVHTFQAESMNPEHLDVAAEYAFRTFIGRFKNKKVTVHDNVYRFDNGIPDDFITEAISNYCFENGYFVKNIQYNNFFLDAKPDIYCYSEIDISKSEGQYVGCDIFIYDEDMLKTLLIEFDSGVSIEFMINVLGSIY